MKEKEYPGIVIETHKVIDAKSKDDAQNSFYGWKSVALTAPEWMRRLELGQTIQPGAFAPKPDGTYSHKENYWNSTYFIAADADNFVGVEFDDEGNDVNPNGIEPWTEINGLSKRFPTITEKAYAISESVSSMSEEKPHRRYRVIFLFDEPILDGQHYRDALAQLAQEFPVITTVKRQPAQPIFGNAREDSNKVYIYGKVLSLSDYPKAQSEITEAPESTPTQTTKDGYGKYNDTQRKYRHKLDQMITDAGLTRHETSADGTVRVDCPFNTDHKRDAFVKLDSEGYPSFKCHHNSCNGKGFNEMAKVTCIEVPFNPRSQFEARRDEAAANYHAQANVPQADADGKVFTDEEIDTDSNGSDAPDFPGSLFTGIFANYRDAMHEANPVPDSFLFATLKQAICASLGRAVFIDTDPVVYPVIYTGLIGDSSRGHKGVALGFVKKLLRTADENVLHMPSLTTEEGFIDMFVEPEPIDKYEDGEKTGEVEGYRGGWYPFVNHKERAEDIMGAQMSHESIRILGTFDEFSQILQRGKKAYTAGMLELMMHLYDAPSEIISPNKHSKSRAEFPTWGVIGCSTFNLIENALDTNYIGGGLTNRFEWYHGESKRSMFTFGKPNVDKWTATVEELNAIRSRFDNPTSYTMTPESDKMGLEWLKQFESQLAGVDHQFVADSLKRQKIMIMKNALVFSVLRNEDTDITPADVEKAIVLSQYTCNVVDQLFSNFHNSETKRVVDRIIKVLQKSPRLTKKQIYHKMQWAELKDVEDQIDRLLRMGVLGAEKPKRTYCYVVLKELDA